MEQDTGFLREQLAAAKQVRSAAVGGTVSGTVSRSVSQWHGPRRSTATGAPREQKRRRRGLSFASRLANTNT
eukprot:2088777-Pyramimonas_sp.AAC.2